MSENNERIERTDDLLAMVEQIKAKSEEPLRPPPIGSTADLEIWIKEAKAKARKAKRRRKGKGEKHG